MDYRLGSCGWRWDGKKTFEFILTDFSSVCLVEFYSEQKTNLKLKEKKRKKKLNCKEPVTKEIDKNVDEVAQ
jgi:hypothetical protein